MALHSVPGIFARSRRIMRHGIPVAVGLGFTILLARQLDSLDFAATWVLVGGVSAWQWLAALIFTGLSFLAVARYDVIALRHFQIQRPSRQATRAGAVAIALGQTLGAGVVVGAFVRWRMVPALTVGDAARLAGFVAITFLASLAVMIAFAALLLPSSHIPAVLPFLILLAACGLVLLGFFFPVLGRGGRRISMPTLPAMAAVLLLCGLDTLFAGLAFYVLMPDMLSIGFITLWPVFLIALGAAVFSGAPGGVGPFELTMLALLPSQPDTALMAAILAFRAVYYAVPAVLGGLVFLSALRKAPTSPPPGAFARRFHAFDALDITGGARAELGVIRQNGGAILSCEGGRCGIVRTGQTLTALFDPLEGHSGALAVPLRRAARAQNRIVCKYKISSRQAVHARRAGWTVIHISDEAILCPADHAIAGPAFRQLRRKLRHASAAGICVSDAAAPLPLTEMAHVSRAWEHRHGAARGLTMGRFDGPYVAGQRVFLAHLEGQLAGFVTFHASPHEWCLDLMRVLPDAPDGTMYALVDHAIRVAASRDIARLSLAAAPAHPGGATALERNLRARFFRHGGGAGLRQFKSCFAPDWQPLFMAAPGRAQLTLAALDLIRAVRAPATPVMTLAPVSVAPPS
ncbi:phosphatidylglycerol lysyltransferase domain-containing protein [Thiosulfatihalobacter marinus]|uniref:phosphatidylglycerol lysyltransferase domain-containing protein n=1 Tax=Thiosulfatihalobacter marinus TaxID=2792481 RepID=UPI0018D6C42C|nr:phosphatidylglycerol lysyltransferase domain-containing protein [Thiosulfatihalobacter marinus]